MNKVYDGTTNATVVLSDNRLTGDSLVVAYVSAGFEDKTVGTNKAVSVTGITVTGPDAGNYSINSPAGTVADITAAPLIVTATGVNKVYDATTAATVSLADNRVTGDSLTVAYASASFADKNVGTGKAVTVSGITVSGSDATNYTFNASATTTADITARALTVSGTGVNKAYDGTAVGAVALADNRISGDIFSTGYTSALFADKNVGVGKPITVSGISLSGVDAGNYSFNSTAGAVADITPALLTVSATGINKAYDGTTTATVSLTDNRVTGDSLSVAYGSASFSDANVGTAKPVTVSGITVSGADAGNYTFNSTANTTANITGRSLVVSATGVNKVYDGTTNATVVLSDNRLTGDTLVVAYVSAGFEDKNVGTNKTVTVSGITVTGPEAGNYSFNSTASTVADITAASLTVSATGANKVYDATTAATVSLTDDRVTGDSLSRGVWERELRGQECWKQRNSSL